MRLDGLEVGGASENVTHLPGVLDRESLVERIRASVIGDDTVLDGPFGGRRLVYADYTASGRALSFVESFIREEVLPLYANTHTDASATGRRMTRLREDARRLIHRSVGGSRKDVVVFCGTGSTGAIDKLVQVLALRIPAALERPLRALEANPGGRAPGRVRRALRAPLERAALAGVDRGRRRDRVGRRRGHRPGAAGGGAAAPRRSAGQDRQLLGRLERDRDRHRRRPRLRSPPSPRRAVVLGLRLRWAVPADRDEPVVAPARLQGRRLPLTTQVRRRAGHAGRAGRQALAL